MAQNRARKAITPVRTSMYDWSNRFFAAQSRAKAILVVRTSMYGLQEWHLTQNSAKPCKKNSFRGGFIFLSSLNVSHQLVKAGRRQTPAFGTGARPREEGARRVVGLRLDTEAGLRGGAAACGAAVASFMLLADRKSCTAASSLPSGAGRAFSSTQPVPRARP